MMTAQTRASGVAVVLGAVLYLWASGAEAAPQTCRKVFFPASGQTQTFGADTNDGISGLVAVPDDGAIEAGKPLSYRDNGDGTISDLNTGLMWEKKDRGGGLHNVPTHYAWSGSTGAEETIWDWLADVNAEDGTGFAGYSDWRIPNLKELMSIVNYGASFPAAASVFSNNCSFGCTVLTCSCTLDEFYWSSTTNAGNAANAWRVDFIDGEMTSTTKASELSVRAVRGGCD